MASNLEAITTLTERGQALLDAREPLEARECFALALAQARAAGVESPFLTWKLAVALDGEGEVEQALRQSIRAVRLDPFALPYLGSRKLIANRARDVLTSESRPAIGPETTRLYEMLSEIGETTPACHVAMAKHYIALGRLDDGRALLDAASLLFPGDQSVWMAKARILRALGDDGPAREAEAIAAACGTDQLARVASA